MIDQPEAAAIERLAQKYMPSVADDNCSLSIAEAFRAGLTEAYSLGISHGREELTEAPSPVSSWGFSEHLTVLPTDSPKVDQDCNCGELRLELSRQFNRLHEVAEDCEGNLLSFREMIVWLADCLALARETIRRLESKMSAEFERGISQERERCAKIIAERYRSFGSRVLCDTIAAAIRNPDPTPEEK